MKTIHVYDNELQRYLYSTTVKDDAPVSNCTEVSPTSEMLAICRNKNGEFVRFNKETDKWYTVKADVDFFRNGVDIVVSQQLNYLSIEHGSSIFGIECLNKMNPIAAACFYSLVSYPIYVYDKNNEPFEVVGFDEFKALYQKLLTARFKTDDIARVLKFGGVFEGVTFASMSEYSNYEILKMDIYAAVIQLMELAGLI
jgi:hypothetical protein